MLLSVGASIGILGFLGIVSNLIIFEILPFLVLAIGVDNLFILVQTYQRTTRLPHETISEHVGRVVGECAPSMLLSSLSEATWWAPKYFFNFEHFFAGPYFHISLLKFPLLLRPKCAATKPH